MENNKTQTKKKKIITVIAFMIIFFSTYFGVQQFFSKPTFDKELVKVANEINKICPWRVDQYMILDNVTVLPKKTIQYNYTIVDRTKSEVNLDTVKKYIFTGILENIKNNPDMKLYRENKVTFNYYYKDKNGVFVCKYVVNPEMYKEN